MDESVRQYYLRKKMEGQLMENDWKENLSFYSTDYPDLATEFLRRMRGELHKIDWNKIKPEYTHLVRILATCEPFICF